MSVMNDQKTETTKRLKTLVHTKKARPIQRLASVPSGVAQRRAQKPTRHPMKKRYATVTNFLRGKRATSAAKIGWATSIARSVPVKSHLRSPTPPATPRVSRIGLMT